MMKHEAKQLAELLRLEGKTVRIVRLRPWPLASLYRVEVDEER